MPVKVTPLDGPLGAKVSGLDSQRPLEETDFRIVHKALVDHQAIVISGLGEDIDWLLSFGRRFGPLIPHVLEQYHHPRSSDISVLTSNMGNAESRRTGKPAGAFWHSDQSYAAKPSDAIFLYSSRIPRTGGDTLVANMALAYDALPSRLKQRIAGRTAIHRYGYRGGEAITPLTPQQQARMIDAEHPVVRVHPISGHKILYISPGYTVCIMGMEATESEELLEELFEHSLRPEFQYRHKWQANQLLGVDNRATMHCAVADYTEARRMLRMLVAGTESQVAAALAP